MKKESKIYVAGSSGLVGSEIVELLKDKKYKNIITSRSSDIDLRNEEQTSNFFIEKKPEYVILAAAKVGGINANNSYPADFIVDNIKIQTNIITQCFKYNVKKLLFLGSSCIYPKEAPQPLKEEYLMTGPLEETNSAYATAKICGIEMCRAYNKQYKTNYICAMPCNLFGERDNFDLKSSHFLAAMINKFHKAKSNNFNSVELWGTGKPRRELLYSKDVAEACLFLMNNFDAVDDDNIINIGSGIDFTIEEYANFVKDISGFKGNIVWNENMPDGTMRKLTDITKIKNLGWKPKYDIIDAIRKVHNIYSYRYVISNAKIEIK